jgi:hypothetical protein
MTLHDLAAFEARYGLKLTPWEADVMKSLDLTQLSVQLAPTRGG